MAQQGSGRGVTFVRTSCSGGSHRAVLQRPIHPSLTRTEGIVPPPQWNGMFQLKQGGWTQASYQLLQLGVGVGVACGLPPGSLGPW